MKIAEYAFFRNDPVRTVLEISSHRLQAFFKMQGIQKCVAVAKPYSAVTGKCIIFGQNSAFDEIGP